MDGKCPWCGSGQGELLPSGQYHRTIGIELSAHQGVLWWECPDCHGSWHRWPRGSKQYYLAEKYGAGIGPGWAGRRQG